MKRRAKVTASRKWRYANDQLDLFSPDTMHRDLKTSNKLTTRRGEVNRTPRAAEYILLLIPKRNREHLIGDLEEEYRTKVLPEWFPHLG